jgi:stress-induced morphogen
MPIGITIDSPVDQNASFGSEQANCLSESRYCILQKWSAVLSKERGPLITEQTLTEYIRRALPDATVTMIDKTGTMDHLKVMIVSDAFQGKNLLDRHRLIYQALDAPMKDGRIHALELTANTKDEHEQRVAGSR